MPRVQVVLAWPHRCLQRELVLEDGATVADEAGGQVAGVAVFGVAVAPSTPLREGDRVELLRPLQLDPKEARRRRAQRQRGG